MIENSKLEESIEELYPGFFRKLEQLDLMADFRMIVNINKVFISNDFKIYWINF